jgi:hypothetical protein
LENNHHIKLYNLRGSISTFKIIPMTMGEGKTWNYIFVAWISKNDVKQLSETPIKNHLLYSKIDEIYYQDRYEYIGLKTRNKRRDSVEFGGKLDAWYRNLPQLAKPKTRTMKFFIVLVLGLAKRCNSGVASPTSVVGVPPNIMRQKHKYLIIN